MAVYGVRSRESVESHSHRCDVNRLLDCCVVRVWGQGERGAWEGGGGEEGGVPGVHDRRCRGILRVLERLQGQGRREAVQRCRMLVERVWSCRQGVGESWQGWRILQHQLPGSPAPSQARAPGSWDGAAPRVCRLHSLQN